MTIGWAATCRDGIVLVTDSMQLRFPLHGSGPAIVTFGRKMDWIGERIGIVTSGSFRVLRGEHVYRLDPAVDRAAVTVEQAAVAVRAELERTHMMDPRGSDQFADIPDVFEALVAGGPPGSTPRLALLRGGEATVMIEPGRIVMTAVLRSWCRERGREVVIENPAESVIEAGALAVTTIAEAMRDLYARFGKRHFADFFPDGRDGVGTSPPAAFPLHLAVFTRDGVARFSVPEPRAEAPHGTGLGATPRSSPQDVEAAGGSRRRRPPEVRGGSAHDRTTEV